MKRCRLTPSFRAGPSSWFLARGLRVPSWAWRSDYLREIYLGPDGPVPIPGQHLHLLQDAVSGGLPLVSCCPSPPGVSWSQEGRVWPTPGLRGWPAEDGSPARGPLDRSPGMPPLHRPGRATKDGPHPVVEDQPRNSCRVLLAGPSISPPLPGSEVPVCLASRSLTLSWLQQQRGGHQTGRHAIPAIARAIQFGEVWS